jgi:hypothetical protein
MPKVRIAQVAKDATFENIAASVLDRYLEAA